MAHLQQIPTVEETRSAYEARLRTYFEKRRAGTPPLQAATSAITASYPVWRANRAAHLVSVFHMFAQRQYSADAAPRQTMTERDLVALMLLCCNMGDYAAPPGSPYRVIASKLLVDVLRPHWRELNRPLLECDKTPTWRIRSFWTAIFYSVLDRNEELLTYLRESFK